MKCRFLVLFGIAFSVLGSALVSAESKSEEAVVTLTSDNFDKFVKENDIALVEFYAPWCGHCKRLAPEYEKAAQKLKESGGIPLAKVDATAEDDLARKYEVNAYPTLKLFRKGKPEEYKGGRTADTILTYLEKMTGPSVEVVADRPAAEKVAKNADVAYVGAFSAKDNEAFKTFEAVADQHRLLGRFIAYVNPAAAEEEVYVHRKAEGKAASIVVGKKDDLVRFCSEERFPYFGPINGDNYGDYFANGKDIVWFAGSEGQYEEEAEVLRGVAKEFRARHSFVWLDSDKFKDHAQSSLGVKEFPSVVAQTKEGRYVFPERKVDAKKVTEFLKDVAAGKIAKFLMSEDIPESNDEPVKVVVGKTFEEMVLQPDKDVMLEVYAPWCGHCKKFEPIYADFAEKMANNRHLIIAKMDGTANESPVANFEWRGFPTIFFVKAGSDTPISFDGARTLDGLTEFVKEHATKPIDVTDTEAHDEL